MSLSAHEQRPAGTRRAGLSLSVLFDWTFPRVDPNSGPMPSVNPRHALLLLGLLLSVGCEKCLKRVEVASVTSHPYPSCGAGEVEREELIREVTLVPGPNSIDHSVWETYRVLSRACDDTPSFFVIQTHQEWARQVTDVEVVFDAEWRPLFAHKQMAVPGVENADETVSTRTYELRNDPPTMSERSADGTVVHREFRVRGNPVVAVVGPGRGIVTGWIAQHADLAVGETRRGDILDFRELLERVDEVAIRRDPARDEPSLGGAVRVYTVFGRESVFTDDEGFVIGDLAGLRRLTEGQAPPEPLLPNLAPPNPRAPL